MSLFKNLLETYDKCKDATGVVHIDADGVTNEKKTFLPIFHSTFKSHICITLDSKGEFIKAERDKKEVTIIIPCTESSAGRANSIAAHPLCDQLDYVGGNNEKKTAIYLGQLYDWKTRATGDSEVKLSAVYDYVKAGKIISDLENRGIFDDAEYDTSEDGSKTVRFSERKEKDGDGKERTLPGIRKLGVRFAVEISGDKTPNAWEDKELRQSWIDYIKPHGDDPEFFDYISGEQGGKVAAQHPKNINSRTGNAKLLSCNDNSGYTFRGRFAIQDDAVIVDYEQSQKMHQTLRWLINNYGYNIDTQAIVAWAVDSDSKAPADMYKDSYNLFSSMPMTKTDSEKLQDVEIQINADYSRKLRNLLQGLGNADKIKEHSRKICIAAFDAATPGRMGLTFYHELPQDKYLENIVNWHEDTSYYLTAFKREKDDKGKEKAIPIRYIGAPSYDDILFAVYGKQEGKSYDTLKKKVRKQLLECMFGNFSFPKNIVDMAAVRASRPMSFNWDKGNSNDWERSLNITCALIRKYYKQQEGEEISLALDEKRKERDYLYGRLLAVADRLEATALYKADKSDTRATNAVRLMSAFAVKPYQTWGILHKQLHPYINQLNGAGYYQKIIDEILLKFDDGEYENNAPLTPLYLLGFSAQRRAFFKDKQNNQEYMEGNDNGTTE